MKSDNADIVRSLIQNGADINAKDNSAKTPLYWAAAYRNYPNYIFT